MTLLEQLISYLSQPPESILYHIVMLLALQATLGLSWWQARRSPEDGFARRLAWASGAILLSRLLILLALFATSGVSEESAMLPPLERAVDVLAAALLVWALAPHSERFPLLSNALLLIVIVVTAVLFLAYASEWRSMVAGGNGLAGYSATQQAVVWSIIQMALLTIGAVLVLYARESQWSLRLVLLTIMFAAQLMSILFGRAIGPSNVEISFWTRLGNVIAYPMLAIIAYRHNLSNLLPSRASDQSTAAQLCYSLELSDAVAGSLLPAETLENAITMTTSFLPSRLVAIAQIDSRHPQYLQVSLRVHEGTNVSPESQPNSFTRVLRDDDWSGLATALKEGRQLLLMMDGTGARLLYDLRQKLDLGQIGLLLVQPMIVEETEIGLILLGRNSAAEVWSDDEKELAQALGRFLAHSLHNAQRYQLAIAGRAPVYERDLADLRTELEQVSEERDNLREEIAQVSDQLAVVRERLDVDHRELRETTQALALAAQRQTKLHRLEDELTSLREALSEAELALAYAAAGEAGLSTEWVMRTVTRYSGELEEAQAQISALQEELSQPVKRDLLEQVAGNARRLRTPLTAIGGYADLLLDQGAGEISAQQETLLRRMRVNVDNMALTIEALSAAARTTPPGPAVGTWLDAHETLEAAIHSVSGQLQAKKLQVAIFVENSLPDVPDERDDLHELFALLLRAACLVAMPEGHIHASLKQIGCDSGLGASSGQGGFLRVSISDNGGSHSQALFESALSGKSTIRTEGFHPETPDLAQMLDSASNIASARAGRIWLDLCSKSGSTLVLLLPLPSVVTEASG